MVLDKSSNACCCPLTNHHVSWISTKAVPNRTSVCSIKDFILSKCLALSCNIYIGGAAAYVNQLFNLRFLAVCATPLIINEKFPQEFSARDDWCIMRLWNALISDISHVGPVISVIASKRYMSFHRVIKHISDTHSPSANPCAFQCDLQVLFCNDWTNRNYYSWLIQDSSISPKLVLP